MWTDDLMQRLIALVREGLSASQIAAALGGLFSRNAILGKIHRAGLAEQWPRHGDKATPGTVKKQQKVKTVITQAKFVPEKIEMPEIKMDDVPLAQRKTLFQLTGRTCRWPFGDPGSGEFFFCGAETDFGSVYCPTHAARAVASGRYKDFVRTTWR